MSDPIGSPHLRPRRRGLHAAILLLILFAGWQVTNFASRPDPVEVLKAAAEELKIALTGFPGVSAIEDDLPYGKQELVFEAFKQADGDAFDHRAAAQNGQC